MKSMLLVDILARELKVWPDNNLADFPAKYVAQDDDGMIVTLDPEEKPDVYHFYGGSWSRSHWTGGHLTFEVSDDFKTAIINRFEWQAAVEALKAEQAAIPALGEYWPGQGGHNGGLVAAHGDIADHYLIISAKDAGNHEWGGRGSESQATSKRDGFANAIALMEGEHSSVKAASSYTTDGHDDFYLPAIAELYHCWLNAPDLFGKSTWYWSSTQRSADYAFSMTFDDGSQISLDKSYELRVRPVRRLFIDSFVNSGGDDSTKVSTERAVELDGVGLPPIGIECELRALPIGSWFTAEIIFSKDSAIVWKWAGSDHAYGDDPKNVEFRPIRTQEQIAAEEREKAISEMCGVFLRAKDNGIRVEDCCARLYDAGYRKQVAK